MPESQYITKPPPTLEEEVVFAARTVFALRHVPYERLQMMVSTRDIPISEHATAADTYHFLMSLESVIKQAALILGIEEVPVEDGSRGRHAYE